MYENESGIYISLPGVGVDSENETVCCKKRIVPKRKCSYRRRVICYPQAMNKASRPVQPTRKASKKSTILSKQNISDKKAVSPTKIRGGKSDPPKKDTRACSKPARKVRNAKMNIKKNRWITGDFEKTTKFPNRAKDFGKYISLSPTELFELFFTDEIWEHIQLETSKYALSTNCADPKITKSELKCFFGILIVSGYNILPGKKFFWDCASDMRNEFVADSMRRERFITIMKFMHWADNERMSSEDKVWKIRPVIDMLQAKFLQNFVPTEHLNYDESMIKYYGRHSLKQFIKGKPIRFGYKVWCMNAENGYLISFEIYQGTGPQPNEAYDKLYGKCTAPLVKMLDNLPEKDLPYQIFTDNLFTSVNLMTSLRKRGYGVTGTVRKNRFPKDLPLPTKTEMEKKDRGSFASAISKDDGYIIARWKDNAVVTMASTTYGVQPLSSASRYSKTDKKKIDLPRPHMITMYNKYMGGTDRMDQDLARHRISIKGKKWYWPLLTWLIDAAIQNAWTLYKCSGRKLTNLKFRRSIARNYLQSFGVAPKRKGRPSYKEQMPSDPRYDRLDHLVEPTANNVRRKCARETCKSSIRTQCRKCDKGLCVKCFVPYHTFKSQ